MSSGEFIAALAANLVVAGAVSYLKGPSFGAICLTAGFLLMIAAYLLRRKPQTPSPPPPLPSQTIIQTQEFNPQFHPTIQIGVPDPRASLVEQEKLRHEHLAIEVLRPYRQADRIIPQLLATIFSAMRSSYPAITKLEVSDALDRLCIKGLVIKKPIEADGGYVYWLSDLAE